MSLQLNSSAQNDKGDSFNKIQMKYFGRMLDPSETLTFTVEQFKTVCAEAHEHGRLRERTIKAGSFRIK